MKVCLDISAYREYPAGHLFRVPFRKHALRPPSQGSAPPGSSLPNLAMPLFRQPYISSPCSVRCMFCRPRPCRQGVRRPVVSHLESFCRSRMRRRDSKCAQYCWQYCRWCLLVISNGWRQSRRAQKLNFAPRSRSTWIVAKIAVTTSQVSRTTLCSACCQQN